MTRQEIFEKLNEVFSDVFDEDITVTDGTTSADIADWDSLTHITLISEVEDTFGIKFSMKDVLGMKNVVRWLILSRKTSDPVPAASAFRALAAYPILQKVGTHFGFFIRRLFIRVSSADIGRILFSAQEIPKRFSDAGVIAVLRLG